MDDESKHLSLRKTDKNSEDRSCGVQQTVIAWKHTLSPILQFVFRCILSIGSLINTGLDLIGQSEQVFGRCGVQHPAF